jgi:hypothetical protein
LLCENIERNHTDPGIVNIPADLEARREELQIAHNFLMADVRNECHHCGREFELEDGLVRIP